MNKKLAQRIHTKRRAAERYGLSLTTLQLKVLERQIREGRALLIERQSLTRALWLVDHEGQKIRVIHHKGRGIVTALPMPAAVAAEVQC